MDIEIEPVEASSVLVSTRTVLILSFHKSCPQIMLQPSTCTMSLQSAACIPKYSSLVARVGFVERFKHHGHGFLNTLNASTLDQYLSLLLFSF